MQVIRSSNSFGSVFISFVATLFLLGCGGGGGSSTTPTPTPTPEVSLSSLTFETTETNLKISETFQTAVTGSYSDGSSKDLTSLVTWSVSDSAVIDISDTGLITALSAGSSTVTATYEGQSFEGSITVIDLVDLSISPTKVTLPVTLSKQLSVTGRYTDNSSEALDHLVTWQSSNNEIASISDTGEVLGISAGSVTITATLGSVSTSLVVTVTPASLQTIIVSSSTTKVPVGSTAVYAAKGIYSDGSEQDLSNQVLWSVSNSSLASINSETGLLTALEVGTLSVIATLEGQTGSLVITVSSASLTGISITPNEISLAKGSKVSVNVTASFSDESKVDVSEQVTWVNSNEQVAIIENNPLSVVAENEGSTTFTFTYQDQSAELLVNVTNAELTSLTVYPVNSSIPLGQSQQFYAQGIFSDGEVQDLTSEVTWLSSNENNASISNDKTFAGLAESRALGSTTLTAVMGQIEQTTTLTVNDSQLSHLEIVPTKVEIPIGAKANIKALGYFSDGSVIDLTTEVVWNTSKTNVLDVLSANQGSLSSISQGSALLSATLDGVVGIADILVTNTTLQSISISAQQNNLPKGMSQKLIATGTYSDMSTRDISQQVNWQSNDVLIASVSNGSNPGFVQANSPGQFSISASLGEVSGEKTFNVTDAELTNIEITTPQTQVNVNSTLLATAVASFSDSSSMDVSSQVNWSSSDINVASIGNMDLSKGLVTGLSSGTANLSASLMGVSSSNYSMDVVLNANLPKAINLSVQPNIILNDNSDTTDVKLVLIPSLESGVIADGTPVTLTITEGETIREVSLETINGVANYSLESEYNGFISLNAALNDYSVNSGIVSTDKFENGIFVSGKGTVVYEDNTLKAGSVFFLLLRNLTNREFVINQINIGYLDPDNNNTFVNFPDSPVLEEEFLSNGNLSAGEFTNIGYELDNDVNASQYVISYQFYDEQSDTIFNVQGIFNFAK